MEVNINIEKNEKMSVFGDIISTNKPVLIVFYAGWHYLAEDAGASVQQVVDALGEVSGLLKLILKKI